MINCQLSRQEIFKFVDQLIKNNSYSEKSRDLPAGRHTYPLALYSSQLSPEEKEAFVRQLEEVRSHPQRQQDIFQTLEQARVFSRTTFAIQCECRKALSALQKTNLPPVQLEPLKAILEDITPAKFRDDRADISQMEE